MHGNGGFFQADPGNAVYVCCLPVDKIDRQATYINSITGISLEKAAVPMHVESDREAMDIALGSVGLVSPDEAKIVRIKNTLELEIVEVSEAYAKDLQNRNDLEIIAGPRPNRFNDANDLAPIKG